MNTSVPSVQFRLDPSFVDQYQTKTPPFGFDGLGELVYLRTYSRLKADGTNEKWWETVRRVIEGTYSMQKKWITGRHLGWDEAKAQESAQEMYERVFTMKFLPPGRGLWAMGSPLTEELGLWAALNSCAFVSTANLATDLEQPFTFLMEASMLGIGVGFDTKGAYSVVIQAPTEPPILYEIPDTREGWVQSLGRLLRSYFVGNSRLEFDYSLIRKAGEPIKGFGGIAAGPEPLQELHEHLRSILQARIGEPISIRNIVDIQNLIGKCVVAGNTRRSAELVFGDASSEEYLNLKNYKVNPERAAFGWASNNSIFAEIGMDYSKVAERIKDNGEPGFGWLKNMQDYGRMVSPPDYEDSRVRGGNPCLEVSLESYELCCLCESFPARHDTLEDYQRTLKFAYLYAKTVTLGHTPWPQTNRVMGRNRRIGCSQSGIVQAIAQLGIEEYRRWCEEGYKTIQYYDDVYSAWLTVPKSIKTTSVKPSGTVSLLAGATPGMHFPESRTYIRRMRISIHSDLLVPLRAAGYTIEPCVGSESSTVVVEIPIRISDTVRVASEVSLWEQLSLAAFLQRYWADNQISCTVTFDPETEDSQIAPALNYFQYQLKGVSFLPRLEHGAYPQMPYEAISEERYWEMHSKITPLNFGQITHEEAAIERFCSNDTCESLVPEVEVLHDR